MALWKLKWHTHKSLTMTNKVLLGAIKKFYYKIPYKLIWQFIISKLIS